MIARKRRKYFCKQSKYLNNFTDCGIIISYSRRL